MKELQRPRPSDAISRTHRSPEEPPVGNSGVILVLQNHPAASVCSCAVRELILPPANLSFIFAFRMYICLFCMHACVYLCLCVQVHMHACVHMCVET